LFTYATVVGNTTKDDVNYVDFRITTEGESIYSSIIAMEDAKLSKSIQKAMNGANVIPNNVTAFAEK